jgi:hypothetical protein
MCVYCHLTYPIFSPVSKQIYWKIYIFSSPELKAQVSYSDRPLSVVRLSVCKRLHFRLLQNHSLSCLQSIRNMNIDHPYILDIVKTYYLLTKQNEIVEFCWIPSHIGIHGNTKSDKAAKDALIYNIALFRIPYTDLKYLIRLIIYLVFYVPLKNISLIWGRHHCR